ncbi:DUF3761 domain-containing protein [Methylobacterium sp. NEAU K]|nr:DUF3761 domain-containing protein [Methylobacterium sp. NEAU K]MDP4005047.1 DUF3761 domain-containing protein [Methylobacterium sp. NEAU K]
MKIGLVELALFGAVLLGPLGDAAARGACPVFTDDEARGRPHYRNSDGCIIPVPEREAPKPGGGCTKPPDATARCRDGDWSFSQHRQGTCSHHGGVGCWSSASQSCCP